GRNRPGSCAAARPSHGLRLVSPADARPRCRDFLCGRVPARARDPHRPVPADLPRGERGAPHPGGIPPMIRRLLLLVVPLLLVTGAFAQDFGLPALPGVPTERTRLTTSLPVADPAKIQSIQATRRTTENSLRQVGQLI